MEVNKELEAGVSELLVEMAEPAPVVEPVVPPTVPVVEPVVIVPPVVPPITPIIELVVEPIVPKPGTVEPSPVVAPIQPPPPSSDPRDLEITSLRTTVDELRRMVESVASQAVAPRPTALPLEPVEPQVIKFVEKEEDLDKILNSVDNFNAFLTKAFNDRSKVILEAMPHLVTRTADTVMTQKMAVNEFYAHNQDLATNKAYVGIVANELAEKNPTWTLEDVIKTLGTEVRTRLKMAPVILWQAGTQPPGTPPSVVPDPPAFVSGSPARPGAGGPAMTRIEAGIADLVSGL